MSYQDYLTATLTDAEANLLSDPNRAGDQVIRDLDRLSHSLRENADPFEESLRVKNTLEAFVHRATVDPSLEVLAAILNCEYRLWKMNEAISMESKPFLSHWIEALMGIEAQLAAWQLETSTGNNFRENTVTTDEIWRIRATFIKGMLVEKPLSPQEPTWRAYQMMLENEASLPSFDIAPYMQMLVETGIWNELPEANGHAVEEPAQKQKQTSKERRASRRAKAHTSNGSSLWQDDMLQKLQETPDIAADELSHLPLEISSLDFLTKLLVDDTFKEFEIDGPHVVLRFIQYALRLVEKMGAPPPTSELTTNGNTNGMDSGTPIVEYGKEAQTRSISILLLFIKSSMSKGKMDAGLLIYEIQEICTRYCWMKEVRDFRAWVEQGPLDV
ncbi:hypothetical protein DDE82_007233 [Stemphylium lycopersici]|uniref:CCR4-NOT transcription complex subunit 11 n=1 Tax=Stemphylium lycopersici TaxID=183478 RepID=A0A364N5T9_STELY|nr:hypothetical protein TW65_07747 [Stemphylium lycopersici]RAR00495.1 hypothetical protein DDE82_007233 [Stemphylium lycopersici]RAR12689.1 hypothetical protein DDE83_003956 [Stemphylium lycopersici]